MSFMLAHSHNWHRKIAIKAEKKWFLLLLFHDYLLRATNANSHYRLLMKPLSQEEATVSHLRILRQDSSHLLLILSFS